jgi:proteasome lid subunit RPN8/RPN11
VILLPGAVREQLTREAEAAYPDECCGLLVGRRQADGATAVERAVASANVATCRRHDRLEVDPRVRFALTRELAGSSSAIVGHYHSHPDHPAEPSATDRAMAFEPDLVWLIVAVSPDRAGEPARAGTVRAFRIAAAGNVFELPIVGVGEPASE